MAIDRLSNIVQARERKEWPSGAQIIYLIESVPFSKCYTLSHCLLKGLQNNFNSEVYRMQKKTEVTCLTNSMLLHRAGESKSDGRKENKKGHAFYCLSKGCSCTGRGHHFGNRGSDFPSTAACDARQKRSHQKPRSKHFPQSSAEHW